MRAFVSEMSCSRTSINWARAWRVCRACCSSWSLSLLISWLGEFGALVEAIVLSTSSIYCFRWKLDNWNLNNHFNFKWLKSVGLKSFPPWNCSPCPVVASVAAVRDDWAVAAAAVGHLNQRRHSASDLQWILHNNSNYWGYHYIDAAQYSNTAAYLDIYNNSSIKTHDYLKKTFVLSRWNEKLIYQRINSSLLFCIKLPSGEGSSCPKI